MEDDKSFLGRGWSFPPQFNKEGRVGVKMVSAEKDIKQSLEILLTTNLGERIMLPQYGCDLQNFLFSSLSTSKTYFLKDLVRNAILDFEPRVTLHNVIIETDEYLEGIIKIKLDYSIIKTNTRFNLVFPYYKVEGTDIPQLFQNQIMLKSEPN